MTDEEGGGPSDDLYAAKTSQRHAGVDKWAAGYLWSSTGMNMIAGTVGGLAGVIVGHPFDTIKVRLQSTQGVSSVGTWRCFTGIIRNEGPAGFYRGMASPLVGVVAVNAFLFGVYGYLLDVQQRVFQTASSDANLSSTAGEVGGNGSADGNGGQPKLWHVFWAGAGSGLANSLISCPIELAKIQLQNQSAWTGRQFRGPWECFQRIRREHGIRGCFRGMVATVWRETPSYGVYFVVFEGIQRHLLHRKHEHIRASLLETEIYDLPNLNGLELMVAGGLSGVAGWLSTYPVDVIKTRIQAQSLSHPKRYASMWDCGQRIVKEEGWRVLWRGTAATVLRAFPTNAVIFLGYSWTMRGMMLTAPGSVASVE